MAAPDYDALTSEYKNACSAGASLPRERYAVRISAGGPGPPEREFEWIAAHLRGLGLRVVALDPELDPRKGLRVDGLRGVSLSNYLNHVVGLARPGLPAGPGSHRWIPVRSAGGVEHGIDTQIDLERQALVLAHDFRPGNPERDVTRAQAAITEFVLLWLEPGWVISGRVFNFDSEMSRAGETYFLNVQAPKAYGDAAGFPWGRGLPFLSLNRKFLVAHKRAAARLDLERFLEATPDVQPRGFAPEPTGDA